MLERVEKLVSTSIGEWGDVSSLEKRVCVYATGSYGRRDASKISDLDLFIVSKEEDLTRERLISGLEEIELLATIVRVNRQLCLPDPDADGSFLSVHKVSEYLVGLGKPSDDADNTFTGRLLLLLESYPLFGKDVYDHALRECVERYWIDFHDHSDSFLPAFLINDILRFWRTLCVNYEAGSTGPPEKRRAKNYKLKHSRMLICYSAIIALQAEYIQNQTISPETALLLLKDSPLNRLDVAKKKIGKGGFDHIDRLFDLYEKFLCETDCSKEILYEKMKDPDYYKSCLSEARQFGDSVFSIMQEIAKTDESCQRFFRYIAV